MSEHYVICRTCRTNNGRNPKRWQWLCVDCAEEHADTHRRQYPDHDIELRVTHVPTMADLQSDMRTARLLRKAGW